MISVGDRIVQVRGDPAYDNVSGIVALSVDMAMADYLVAIWDGANQGRAAYVVTTVNEFGYDVAERGCKYPPLPMRVAAMLSAAVAQARRDARVIISPLFKKHFSLMRECMQKAGSAEIMRAIVASFREKSPGADLLSPSTRNTVDGVIIHMMKQTKFYPTGRIWEMQAAFVAWQEEYEKAVKELAAA